MYDTGDLGRWLPDGNIAFLGRKDNQVKIRGYRLELNEVESAIRKFPKKIKEVLVTTTLINSEKTLICYFVTDEAVSKADLRAFLQKTLPAYMVPDYYIDVEQFSLTTNGKINKKALPDITNDALVKKQFQPAETYYQKTLQTIWSRVLKIDQIGIKDNFFELGGNSLLIHEVLIGIRKLLGKKLSYVDFYANQTIENCALILESYEIDEELMKVEEADFIHKIWPLTQAQHRIFMSHNDTKTLPPAYNIPAQFYLNSDIDLNLLEEAIRELIRKHVAMRTVFIWENETLMQQPLSFDVADQFALTHNTDESKIDDILDQYANTIFEADQFPFIKVNATRTTDRRTVINFVIHHIICDGVSMEYFKAEILQLYDKLANKKEIEYDASYNTDYIKYIVAEQHYINAPKFKADVSYWTESIQNADPIPLTLPSNLYGDPVQKHLQKGFIYKLDKEQTHRLGKFSDNTGTSLFNLLLSYLQLAFAKQSGDRSFLIGLVLDGRNLLQNRDTLGNFINTVPYIVDFLKQETVGAFMQRNFKKLNTALDYGHFPFNVIAKDFSNIWYNVIVSYASFYEEDSDFNALFTDNQQEKDEKFVEAESKFNMGISIFASDELEFHVTYNSSIFSAYDIENLFELYEQLLFQFDGKHIVEEVVKITPAEAGAFGDKHKKTGSLENPEQSWGGNIPVIFGETTISFTEISSTFTAGSEAETDEKYAGLLLEAWWSLQHPRIAKSCLLIAIKSSKQLTLWMAFIQVTIAK